MKLGAQLYTVREYCKDLDSLDSTLRKVSEIGYSCVQLSGVCAYDASWMAEKLEKYSLTADITHFDINRICDDTESVIAHHKTMNCRHIGIGSSPFGTTPEGAKKLCERLYPALVKINGAGLRFMFHNHNSEYSRYDKKSYMDILLELIPAELMGITADAYWMQAAGVDPSAEIERLSGRVNCVHLKDMIFSPEDKAVRMAPVGRGNMNYEGIIKACYSAGVSHVFVEQDNCYGEDPFDCLKESYIYLEKLVK